MDGPSKEVLSRMPLAEAVLLLFESVTSKQRMQSLWNAHRGRCYEKVISFTTMVHLLADALLKHRGSGRRAFEKGIENGELETTVGSAFKKLGRLPVVLSQAFLSQSTATLRQAFPEWAEWKLPTSLRRFRVIILDGKTLKRVAKRLKPLQGIAGGLLGGRALVALEWSTGLVVGMRATEDGDAHEVKFVGELVPMVCEQVEGPRLWLGDRAFCDLTQPGHFTANDGDCFLVRYQSRTSFSRDNKRKLWKGKDDRGRKMVQEWGYLGSPNSTRRRYVRRICVDRGAEKPLILVTDLLDAGLYPADDLLWLYSERWGIEHVFQKVTEVFQLKRLIGGTPKACIFQFAFCLLLYNMIQVLRGYVAQSQNLEPEDISAEKLFDDVKDQLIAWNVLFEPEVTLAYFAAAPNPVQLRRRLQSLMRHTWSNVWLKSPTQETHRKTPKIPERTHSSVYRILQGPGYRKPKRGSPSP